MKSFKVEFSLRVTGQLIREAQDAKSAVEAAEGVLRRGIQSLGLQLYVTDMKATPVFLDEDFYYVEDRRRS